MVYNNKFQSQDFIFWFLYTVFKVFALVISTLFLKLLYFTVSYLIINFVSLSSCELFLAQVSF